MAGLTPSVCVCSEALGHENPVFLGGSPQTKTRTVSQIMTRQSSETGRHLLSEPGTPLSPSAHGDVFFPIEGRTNRRGLAHTCRLKQPLSGSNDWRIDDANWMRKSAKCQKSKSRTFFFHHCSTVNQLREKQFQNVQGGYYVSFFLFSNLLPKHPALGASTDGKMPTHLCKTAFWCSPKKKKRKQKFDVRQYNCSCGVKWSLPLNRAQLAGAVVTGTPSSLAVVSKSTSAYWPILLNTIVSCSLCDSTWNPNKTFVTLGNFSLWFLLSTHSPDIPDILRCAVPFPGRMVSYDTQCQVEMISWKPPPPLSYVQDSREIFFWTSVAFVDHLMQVVRYNIQGQERVNKTVCLNQHKGQPNV